MQGFTLATAAMAIGLAYLFLVRFDYASRWLAFGSVALTVTTPFLHFIGTRVLSEMPFALLLVCALWRIERDIRRPPGRWTSQFLTGALIAFPYLCRSVGVVLIAAVFLVLIVRRRPWVMTLLGASVTAGPWIYWSLTALGQWQHDSIVGYYTDYLGSWSVLSTNPGEIIGWNLIYLLVSTVGTSLVGVSMGATWLFGWKLARSSCWLGPSHGSSSSGARDSLVLCPSLSSHMVCCSSLAVAASAVSRAHPPIHPGFRRPGGPCA